MTALTALDDVNYAAVAAAAALRIPLAGLWHSPLLFGRTWERMVGLDSAAMRARPLPVLFGFAFLTSLGGAFVLALLLGPDAGAATGALVGLLAGAGLAGGAVASSMVFEARPRPLAAIDAAFHTVLFTATGAILGVW